MLTASARPTDPRMQQTTNTALSLAQKISALAAVHSWRGSGISPTSENRLKTKVWLNACRCRRAKMICQSARESQACCPDSGALGFPTKQNISNLRCAKGALKWRMTMQGQIRLSYATSSIFVGWWRGMQGVPQLTLFLSPARALIRSWNNFFWLTTSAPTTLQRAITGLGGDYWLLIPGSVHLATAAYHV
jgi:hypothetical protein